MIWRERGVTLIELMITMVISAFLVAAMYTFFITQQRTYAVQDNVADMQQNARMSLITLVRNVRMAGYGVPSSCALAAINSTTAPDGIFVSNSDAIQILPDSVIFYAELASNVSAGATSITVNAGDTDIDGNGSDDFVANGALIISDGTNTEGMVIANGYTSGDATITFASGFSLANAYTSDTASVVPAIYYTVSNHELVEDNQSIALNIEDLQIAYQDSAGNWYCSDASHTVAPTDISSIRVVDVNVLARTNVEDTEETTLSQPALKDHTTSLSTSDGFRRRLFSTQVNLRNLGL